MPAQPAAGVTKSHAVRRALHLTPERAIAEMEKGELHLDAAAAAGLRKHIALLERQSEDADRYRQALCQKIRCRTMLTQPELSPALLEKSMAAFDGRRAGNAGRADEAADRAALCADGADRPDRTEERG